MFLLLDAFKTCECYTYSESYGTKEHSGNQRLMSFVEIKPPGILSSLRTQTGPWSDTFSYVHDWFKVLNMDPEVMAMLQKSISAKVITLRLMMHWLSTNFILPHPALPNCDRASLHGCCCQPTQGRRPKLFQLEDTGLDSHLTLDINKNASGWRGPGVSGRAREAGGGHPQLDRGDQLQHCAGRHVRLPPDSPAWEGHSSR